MVKRLMCFVDESGQDARSESFVVAVIASKSDLKEALKQKRPRLVPKDQSLPKGQAFTEDR